MWKQKTFVEALCVTSASVDDNVTILAAIIFREGKDANEWNIIWGRLWVF